MMEHEAAQSPANETAMNPESSAEDLLIEKALAAQMAVKKFCAETESADINMHCLDADDDAWILRSTRPTDAEVERSFIVVFGKNKEMPTQQEFPSYMIDVLRNGTAHFSTGLYANIWGFGQTGSPAADDYEFLAWVFGDAAPDCERARSDAAQKVIHVAELLHATGQARRSANNYIDYDEETAADVRVCAQKISEVPLSYDLFIEHTSAYDARNYIVKLRQAGERWDAIAQLLVQDGTGDTHHDPCLNLADFRRIAYHLEPLERKLIYDKHRQDQHRIKSHRNRPQKRAS